MKFFGALLTLCGLGGLIYSMQIRGTAEYQLASLLGANSDTVTAINTIFYASIAALVIGALLFIAGFAKKR